jgi:hypothetical protein
MTSDILEYNSVEEIELPEEALEAGVFEMPDFDFDLEGLEELEDFDLEDFDLEELEDFDLDELEELDLEELEEENDE